MCTFHLFDDYGYGSIDLGLYGPFKSTLGLRLLRLQHIEAYRLTFDISPIRPARIQWANCRVAMDVLWALIWNFAVVLGILIWFLAMVADRGY